MKKLGFVILLLTFVLGINAQVNKDSLRGVAASLANTAISIYNNGDYQKALDIQKQAIDIYEKTGDKNNRNYAALLNNLSYIYSCLGEYHKAIEMGIKAMKIQESVLGKSDPEYATSLNNLALNYSHLGDYDKAMQMGIEALKIIKSVVGTNHSDYATLLNNIAIYYSNLGNDQKAIEVGTEALRIRETVLGKKHPDYAISLGNIAKYYSNLGNHQMAIKLETEALKTLETILGKNHPNYAKSLNNLATYYCYSGNYQKAIEFGTMALTLRETLLGKQHPEYVSSLSNLAAYYSDLGIYQKAIELNTEASKIIESVLGKENTGYAETLGDLSNCYFEFGNYQKSIELNTEALKIIESVSGKNHPDYAISLDGLSLSYSNLGDYYKAIKLGTEAMKIKEIILGKNNPEYAKSLNNMALYYSYLNNYQKAAELGAEALKISETIVGKNSLDYVTSLNNLAGYYFCLGKFQKSVEMSEKALEISDTLLAKNNPVYVVSLNNLARYYSYLRNYQKSIEFATKALKIREKILGKQHPNYALSLGTIADSYLDANNYNSALNYLMSYDKINRDIIRNNFQTMTASERYYFWDKYSLIYNEYLPSVDNKVRSEQSECLCYNSQLLSKGLLLTMGTEMKKLIQESGDTSVINKYEALQQTRSILRKLYELPISKRSMNTDSLETVAQQIEKELVKGSKQYGDFTRNMLLEWQDVQKELKNNDAAIEFVNFPISKDSTEYAAMVLRKDMKCPKMIDLCLEPELMKHQKNGTRMYDGYENKAVYALVWKKLEPYLHEGDNVYFSPSGLFYQMNIEALKDSTGKMANEKYHLYRVSSTKELCYQNAASKIKTATLYGGLVYDMDSTTICNESRKYHLNDKDYMAYRGCLPDSISRGAWAQLPQTGREVDMIANELKNVSVETDVMKGINGTEESFKSLSGKNISVIHLATHGFFLKDEEVSNKKFFENIMQNNGSNHQTDTSMKRSGLIFAGGQKAWLGGSLPDNVEDGILLAEEIPTIDLRGTDLLVLSACDTGLGEVNSEGVFGLQRGFKQAGVKTIVMSLWKVSDNATALFMSQFYKNLTDGQTKQQAFMNAQKTLRDSNDFSDPKYWAAFIMLDAI